MTAQIIFPDFKAKAEKERGETSDLLSPNSIVAVWGPEDQLAEFVNGRAVPTPYRAPDRDGA